MIAASSGFAASFLFSENGFFMDVIWRWRLAQPVTSLASALQARALPGAPINLRWDISFAQRGIVG